MQENKFQDRCRDISLAANLWKKTVLEVENAA